MNLIIKIKNNPYIIDFLFYSIVFLFILAGILISVYRFWQYEVFFYDFGIFDQAIWSVSNLKPPIIDHLVIGGKWIFADHFSPSIFLFSPLYWFTDRSEALLIVQALVVGLTGIVIYHLGRTLVKNKILALSSALSFYLFLGVQNAVISDFHEVTISTLPLALIFWFVYKKKILSYFISLIILLGFKESIFLLGISIGFLIFFIQRTWWKIGIATIVLSLTWGIISIKFIIPYFSEGIYQYFPYLFVGPDKIISSFFNNSVKINTLWYSFYSFGFLPLIAYPFWPSFLQDFFTRFFPQWTTRWGLGLHYSAQMGVLLAISTIYSFSYIQKYIPTKILEIVAIFLIINSIFLYSFKLRGPFALAYNPAFYRHTQDFRFLDEFINKIPKNTSIMTQNNLASHFTHQKAFLLRDDYKGYYPDYILFDTRQGQNLNNFFGIKNPPVLFKILSTDKDYNVVFKTKEQFLLKRK